MRPVTPIRTVAAILFLAASPALAAPGLLLPAVKKRSMDTGTWSTIPVGDAGEVGNGVRIAVGDVEGDGVPDLVASTLVSDAVGGGFGGGPRIKIFDGVTGAELTRFAGVGTGNASPDFVGGGAGRLLVSSPGGGLPVVKVYDNYSRPLRLFTSVQGPYALYPSDYQGGVRVAVGDVDGDGAADLIAAATKPRANVPKVIILFTDGAANRVIDFGPSDPTAGGAGDLALTTGDLDGDGRAEIITMAPDASGTKKVKVYATPPGPAHPGTTTITAREVLSFSWGQSNPTSIDSSGLGAGKASFSDISVMFTPTKKQLLLSANDGSGPIVSALDIDFSSASGLLSAGELTPIDLTALNTGDLAENWDNLGFTVGYAATGWSTAPGAGLEALPTSGSLFLAPTIVPEPASVATLACVAAMLRRRRRPSRHDD